MTLHRWRLDDAGAPHHVSGGVDAGKAEKVRLVPLGPGRFATVALDDGDLHVRAWRLVPALPPAKPTLALQDEMSFLGDARAFAASRPGHVDALSGHDLLVVAQDQQPYLHALALDVHPTTGGITLLGVGSAAGRALEMDVAPLHVEEDAVFGTPQYVVATRDGHGNLHLFAVRVPGDGKPELVDGHDAAAATFPATNVRVQPLGEGGALVVHADDDGHARLAAYDATDGAGAGVRFGRVADHEADAGHGLDACRLSSPFAEGDYVTAHRTDAGALRMQAWRVGDRPLHEVPVGR